jgi:Transposase IS66 family
MPARRARKACFDEIPHTALMTGSGHGSPITRLLAGEGFLKSEIWAHLVRELTAAAQAHPDEVCARAGDRRAAGFEQRRPSGPRRLTQIPPEIADPLHDRWRHAILCGLATHRPAAGWKQAPTRNLLVRLLDRDEQVLRFARDLTVPFTNSQAEGDLRPAKTLRGSRSRLSASPGAMEVPAAGNDHQPCRSACST